jgi:hypothetical protein
VKCNWGIFPFLLSCQILLYKCRKIIYFLFNVSHWAGLELQNSPELYSGLCNAINCWLILHLGSSRILLWAEFIGMGFGLITVDFHRFCIKNFIVSLYIKNQKRNIKSFSEWFYYWVVTKNCTGNQQQWPSWNRIHSVPEHCGGPLSLLTKQEGVLPCLCTILDDFGLIVQSSAVETSENQDISCSWVYILISSSGDDGTRKWH